MPLLGSAFALPSLQRQHLLTEFASLQYASFDGIYMSITPGDSSLWTGVIFVRKGPYAPAILRIQISFPQSYPALPPLVTFSTDIFHPLVTPLTTYTYTTGSASGDTVSATDEERLPPGGFSLRHGFPHWFGRAQRSRSPQDASGSTTSPGAHDTDKAGLETKTAPPVAKVLKYIQASFTDEDLLDSVTLESAANPGAYHAWTTYREARTGPMLPSAQEGKEPGNLRSRRPGEWNWEGVWEERVKKGVQASISEAVLYGNGGDDVVRFTQVDAETLEKAKSRIVSSS
ncbi:UBC-like protein [Saccharata proteae CBS 121410]|uniref:UBC-like protein n=1 Tax=Saccharata proteae CBS 121410 TaxID=1314787 RepID=A0A9P4I159_9PEZI|nr:UBC-like protein [Saccharata proteae CBS 121410]